MRFTIEVPVRAEWANAERLRASVSSCVMAMSGDADASHCLALVTAELAENAVKYGHYAEGTGTFGVRVWTDPEGAHVEVRQPLRPDADSARDLFDTLSWIATFSDARTAYEARLLEIASAPRRDGTSRIGLVRLAYEARCTLRAEIDGEMLCVTADLPLSAGPASASARPTEGAR